MSELRGYLPAARPRWLWVTCPLTDDGQGEPLQVEIRTNLTFGEIDAIDTYSGKATFQQLWQAMAPSVRAWNLLRRDLVSGEVVAVPPPLEAGSDVFAALDESLTYWLAMEIRRAHLGGEERGKGVSSPESQGGEQSDAASAEAELVTTAS